MGQFTNACITGARDLIELLKAMDRGDKTGVERNADQVSASVEEAMRTLISGTADLDDLDKACLTGARDLLELVKADDRGDVAGRRRNMRQVIASLKTVAEEY